MSRIAIPNVSFQGAHSSREANKFMVHSLYWLLHPVTLVQEEILTELPVFLYDSLFPGNIV